MDNVELRPMTSDDFDAVYELWNTTDGVGLRPVDDDQSSIVFFLQSNPDLSVVACSAGQLIGAVLCGTDGRRGYIHHLAVASDWRRRGVGSRLIEHVTSALRSRGIRKASIDVFVDNEEAIAFWRATGFVDRPDICRMSFVV